MIKHLIGSIFFLAVFGLGAACAEEFSPVRIAVVVQQDGLPWYERMREGVDAFAIATGHEAFLTGPAQANADLQIALLDDMIADQAQAICLIPVDAAACADALARARAAGIVIITDSPAVIERDLVLLPYAGFQPLDGPDPLRSGYIEWEQAGNQPTETRQRPAYDPAALAYAMLSAAVKLIEGERIGVGTNLDVMGYESLETDPNDSRLLFGTARLFIE